MKKDRVKIAKMIYRTAGGWRIGARFPPPMNLQWKKIDDPNHEKSLPELKRLRAAFAGAAPPTETLRPAAVGTLDREIDEYLTLPQVQRLECFKDGSREMHLRTLATAALARLGPRASRGTIKKRDWEMVLGQLQTERKWAENTFNNWKTSLQDFYTEMTDPDDPKSNPASFIETQVGIKQQPKAIPYAVIKRVLARLDPGAMARRSKVAFQQDQLARRLRAQEEPVASIARVLGVTYNGARKLLNRKPLAAPRQTERISLWLRVFAYTGIRPVQQMKIEPDTHFHPKTSSVWVTQCLKRDNSYEKKLSPQGLSALQAVADANAWGYYDQKRARTMLAEAWRAEKLPAPAPTPYAFRHSYVTAALNAGVSPEELCLDTGHTSPKQIVKTYGTGAHAAIRKSVADRFGAHVAAEQKAPPAAKKKGKGADVVVFAPRKKGSKVTKKLPLAQNALRRKA